MKWSQLAIASLAAFAGSVSAFAPAGRAFVPRATYTSSLLSMANVDRLTDPANQLLDKIDVFIFDCDGVIWRVSRTESG